MLLLFLLLLPCAFSYITLPLGNIEGVVCEINPSVIAYLGVPYGEAPVKDLRFRPPKVYANPYPEPYLNATMAPSPCPQTLTEGMLLVGNCSEDCLYSSIWAPVNAEAGSLPVRVYIHGGGFAHSSASDTFLVGCNVAAESNVVQVNIQYRLGVLGFIALPGTFEESNTTGNWGVLDIQLAIKWVKDNISPFGGDPEQIVIFGQSAGALAVAIQVALESNAGVFKAAHSMSVPGYTSASSHGFGLASLEQAYAVADDISPSLGCDIEDAKEQLACYRALDMKTILDNMPTSISLIQSKPSEQVLSPIVDGTVIERQLVESFASGKYSKVPYLVSSTMEEATYMFAAVGDPADLTMDDVESYVADVYPTVDFSVILSMYNLTNYIGSDYPYFYLVSDIYTDIFFSCANYAALKYLDIGNFSDIYSYYFIHTPHCGFHDTLISYDVDLGCTHADDVYFAFYETFNLPPPYGTCNFTAAEVVLSEVFLSFYTTFASTGVPAFANGTEWVKWTAAEQLKTVLDVGDVTTQKVDFAKKCEVYMTLSDEDEDSVKGSKKRSPLSRGGKKQIPIGTKFPRSFLKSRGVRKDWAF